MGIRIQHTGGGAGAGVTNDRNFQRKYDYQLRQREKLQDQVFQMGMQNRNAMLQRDNTIFDANIKENQRRAAEQDARGRLLEEREFQAGLRKDARKEQLEDMAAAEERANRDREAQWGRADEVADRNRQLGLEDMERQRNWEASVSRATQRGVTIDAMMAGEYDYDPQLKKRVQQTLDNEEKILGMKDVSDAMKFTALAQNQAMQAALLERRRPPQQAQGPLPFEKAMEQDPKLRKEILDTVIGYLSADGTVPSRERIAQEARGLYGDLFGAGGQQGGMPQGQMGGQAAVPGGGQVPPAQAAPTTGVGQTSSQYKTGVDYSVNPAPGASTQPTATSGQAATGQDSDTSWMPRPGAPMTDYSKVKEAESLSGPARQGFDNLVKARDGFLSQYEQYKELEQTAKNATDPAARRQAAEAIEKARATDGVMNNPEYGQMIAGLIDMAADPRKEGEENAIKAARLLDQMGIDLSALANPKTKPKSVSKQAGGAVDNAWRSIQRTGNAVDNAQQSIQKMGNAPDSWFDAIKKLKI